MQCGYQWYSGTVVESLHCASACASPTLGMAMAGSLRSPDRFAPATMPVTAGKKTANTEEETVGEKVEVGGKELEGRSRRDEGGAA